MDVVYEDNHLLVVEKPIGIPVQEDSSKDIDMVTILKKYRKEKENKPKSKISLDDLFNRKEKGEKETCGKKNIPPQNRGGIPTQKLN